MKSFRLLFCSLLISIFLFSPLHSQISSADSSNTLTTEAKTSLDENYFQYLQYLMQPRDEKVLFGLFSKATPVLDDLRIAELHRYLSTFPAGNHRDEVLVMLGDAYKEAKQPAMALGAYLEQVVVYPESPSQAKTQATLLELVGQHSDLQQAKEQLSRFLGSGVVFENYQRNYRRYLHLLHQLNVPAMSTWFFDAAYVYLKQFPIANGNDQIYLWIGDVHRAKDENERAVYAYTKLEYLFPQSQYLPVELYRKAVLYREKLDKPEEATASLRMLIQDYPTDSLAVRGNMLLAQLQSDNLDKPKEAIQTYQHVIDRYPESGEALDAYLAQAELYREKLDEPSSAVERYMTLIKIYPDSTQRCAEALRSAGDVYANKIRDYYTAVKTYQEYAQKYPFDKEVSDRLLKAATLAENRLNNPQLAINILETIQEKYPNSKEARTAERRLPKLRERADSAD